MPRLLNCSCAVAEYRGTSYMEPDIVLKNYGLSRINTNKGGYGNRPHTFVVMVITEGSCEGLKKYVEKHKLGQVWETAFLTNINHSNDWNVENYHGNRCQVVVYAPDHKALTEWIKKSNPDYSL